MRHRKKGPGSKSRRNAGKNVGGKPRATAGKTAAPAPLLDARLKRVARIAFRLGGED